MRAKLAVIDEYGVLDPDARIAEESLPQRLSPEELEATYATQTDLAAISRGADLLGAFKAPLWSAHRSGGNLVYPEQSMEGIAAALDAGFAPELDIRPLADGTLVLCHDDTVDRTMTGATGNVSALTPEQWRAARLKPVIPGGRTYVPVFWEDVLKIYGGRGIFFVEAKANTNSAMGDAAARAINESILRYGLQKSIVVCSFVQGYVQWAAADGLETMFLSDNLAPATIKALGAKWVGSSNGALQSYGASVKAEGMKWMVYGLSTLAEAQTRVSWGADVVMADDPWWLTDRYQTVDKDPLARMESWVGMKNNASTDFKYVPKSDGTVALYMKGNPGIRMPWAGAIKTNSRLLATWKFGTVGASSTSVRFYLGTTKDLHSTNLEGATDNFYLVMVRRNGTVEMFKKQAGATASLTGTGAANPLYPVLVDGTTSADMPIQFDILPGGVFEFTNLTTGNKRVFTDASPVNGPYYLSGSLGGGTPQPEAEFRNIMRLDL